MARTSDSGMETASLGSDENHPSPTSPISPLGRCRRPVEDLPYELLSPASPSSGLGSTGTPATSPPPVNITPVSGVLAKGKMVIRPIAFKPTRFSNAGERYGSTPILARPGSQLTLYGSSHDLRLGSANYSLDRKLTASSGCSPPMAVASLSSLPGSLATTSSTHTSTSGSHRPVYDSLDGIRTFSGSKCSPIRVMSAASSSGPESGFSSVCSPSLQHQQSGTGPPSSLPIQMHKLNTNGGRDSAGDDSGLLESLTPSPSDAGGHSGDLEAALRDRDSELAYLRQTMEHNEHVIFRVYQEKERAWEREIRRLKGLHENRLKAGHQRALKLEQLLMMQTYQLQQEKRRLREEAERGAREAAELRQEVEVLRARLEETEWNLCQRNGALAHAKSQLKEAQAEQTSRTHELASLRTQLREQRTELEKEASNSAARAEESVRLQAELNRVKVELEAEVLRADRLESRLTEGEERREAVENENRTIEKDLIQTSESKKNLESENKRLSAQLSEQRASFDRERLTWAQEKEKVLRYQRQLQLNYVQMYRRSRTLEAEIDSLTMDLELEKPKPNDLVKKQMPALEMGHNTIEL